MPKSKTEETTDSSPPISASQSNAGHFVDYAAEIMPSDSNPLLARLGEELRYRSDTEHTVEFSRQHHSHNRH